MFIDEVKNENVCYSNYITRPLRISSSNRMWTVLVRLSVNTIAVLLVRQILKTN